MFLDIASEEEKLKVQKLYQENFKAVAIVYMLRRVKKNWDALLGKPSEVEPVVKPRTVRINEGGSSRFTVMQ